MLTLSSNTSPVVLAPGINSCIRFRQRSMVLLPHPDGPMIAVTVFAGNSSDTSRTARCCPNSAVSFTVSSRSRVLADAAIALPRDPASGERDDQYESHQHERGRPRDPMPVIVRAGRIHVDLQRQRLHRLIGVDGEIEVSERGEQQRGRLTGHARDPDQTSGDDSGQGGARHDLERGAPPCVAECERRFAQGVRHQAHHLFRRAREHRDHENRERHAAGERGEVPSRPDDERPPLDPDDDRRRAVQNVGDEPDQESHPARSVLRQVQPGADADGDADERREPDDDPGPDDGVRDATARLPCGHRTLGKKCPVDRRCALHDQIAQNQDECQDGEQREQDDEAGHQPARDVAAQGAGAVAVAVAHSAWLPVGAPRPTRQIRIRAIALTATVRTNRISPTSNRADRYRLVVASLNSFAIAAAIVYAGCRSEMLMSCRFPMSIVTAIVSPSARPRPRMTAPIKPARPYGRTADRTASHRVAPMASAASRWLAGTASSTSRDTAAMYGTIMIARMIPPANNEFP